MIRYTSKLRQGLCGKVVGQRDECEGFVLEVMIKNHKHKHLVLILWLFTYFPECLQAVKQTELKCRYSFFLISEVKQALNFKAHNMTSPSFINMVFSVLTRVIKPPSTLAHESHCPIPHSRRYSSLVRHYIDCATPNSGNSKCRWLRICDIHLTGPRSAMEGFFFFFANSFMNIQFYNDFMVS